MPRGRMNMRGARLRTLALALAGVSATGLATPFATAAYAQDASRRDFNIPAQGMAGALETFGRQSGRDILFDRGQVANLRSNSVRGSLEPGEALRRLIGGSGLSVSAPNSATFVVGRGTGEGQAGSAAADSESASNENSDIVVVGSLIRGVNPTAPIESYTREQIERTGSSTIDQFARRIPQNLGDATQEGRFGIPNKAGLNPLGGASLTRGSSFNLRGLGTGGTLTLINGSRFVGSGEGGGFVDISMLPLTAVERVDILTDGASAIYGSDAIGGVVNLVLRRNFEGAESTLRYGFATRGGGDEMVASQLAGVNWSTGNLTATYEYRDVGATRSIERPFITPLFDYYLVSPEQTHKAILLFRQDLTSNIEFSAQGLYGHRDTITDELTITPDFRSRLRQDLSARTYGAGAGLTADMGDGWAVAVNGTYSRSDEARVGAGLFTIPPDTNFPSASTYNSRNQNASAFAKVDGPLFSLPGGSVRVALYGEHRWQSLDLFNRTNNGAPQGADATRTRSIDSVAGEMFVPLISEANRRPGAERMELSFAARLDHYSDFGTTTNPRIGVLYSPVRGLNLRGTWSTAFHAPPLGSLIPNKLYVVSRLPDPTAPDGITVTIIDNSTGTVPLQPETAETWTLGLDIQPVSIPNLRVRATLYEIDYKDRIAFPPFPSGDNNQIFSNPAAANLQFLVQRNPSVADLQEYYTCTDCRFFNSRGVPPSGIEAVLDARPRNLARTRQRGLDVSVDYSVPLAAGELSASLSGTYIFKNAYIVLQGSAPIDIRNRISLPVDFRAFANVSWRRDGFVASISANYVDGYRNDNFTPNRSISSWTTFDANLSYTLSGPRFPALLRGTTVGLFVQNLTDQAPPFVEPSTDPGVFGLTYDSANASAVGRYVGLLLRKSW